MKKGHRAILSHTFTMLPHWALAFGCVIGWGSFVMPGTTFLPGAGPVGTVIELYAALTKAVGTVKTEDAVPEKKLLEQSFEGRRLLLVDDIEVNREIACAVLEMSGFQVEEACDGTEAVEKVAASQPGHYDAVLMDIQMPVMDGYQAARAIRTLENPALAAVPIIAMTANAFDEDIKAAKDAGMDGHVAKPIDIQVLLAVLRTILSPKEDEIGTYVI